MDSTSSRLSNKYIVKSAREKAKNKHFQSNLFLYFRMKYILETENVLIKAVQIDLN